jgi:hypothetical protein
MPPCPVKEFHPVTKKLGTMINMPLIVWQVLLHSSEQGQDNFRDP